MGKHNLTTGQRRLLVAWAAEGLDLREINECAAKEDPPFEVTENNLKHVRRHGKKTYSQLKEEYEREAATEGYARRGVRIREISALIDRHLALIKARGEEMAGEVAGGGTGLLARDYRGKDADTLVYKYDAAPVREVRGLWDDLAREVGDRKTNMDLTT